jgi:hypothetical protein
LLPTPQISDAKMREDGVGRDANTYAIGNGGVTAKRPTVELASLFGLLKVFFK